VSLKYFDILFTSLEDLAGIRRDSFLILASLSVDFSPFFSDLTGLVLEVNLLETICLNKFLFLSTKSASYPEL